MKYIFTENQFMTLLALMGKKKMIMFSQNPKLLDSDIIHAVAELYRMKRVVWEQNNLVPSDDIRKLAENMEQSNYITKIFFNTKIPSCHLIYQVSQRRIVILEKSITASPSPVKLWEEDIHYYVHDLFENDMVPESMTEERREAEGLEELALGEIPEKYTEQDILLTIQRLRADDGEADHRIDVFCRDIFIWIHICREDDSYYHIYSSEELGNLLLNEIRGADL